jgi:hypothetical protein
MVVHNYRESAAGVELYPASRLIADMKAAAARRRRDIVLEGAILNITAERARTLASAYRRFLAGHGTHIARAAWLPTGPLGPGVLTLLRHVRELEIGFQSSHARVRRLYRERYRHAAYVRTLAALRRASIEPTLCIQVGLPGDDEAGLLETCRRAYSLNPRRVTVTLAATAEELGERNLERQWRSARMSADSYNHWKRVAEERRARKVAHCGSLAGQRKTCSLE